MAAPLAVARSRLALFQANSKCFDLLKVFYLRLYSSSNKNKRNSVDLERLFEKKSTSERSAKKSKSRRHENETGGGELSDKDDRFDEMLKSRRKEALHSILVRTHQPETTLQKLKAFGPLEYAGFTSPEWMYILAQYENERSVESLMQGSSSFSSPTQFPMHSRVLHDNSRHLVAKKKKRNQFSMDMVQLYPEGRTHNSFYELKESFDEEVLALQSQKSLTELDLRLRFFICTLLEDGLKSLLPKAEITPYGSCLNGFGWWDGDLDMMLSFQGYSSMTRSANDDETSFKFLTEVFATERQMAQRTLSAMAGMIELMPRVTRVLKILNARVPIIRFRHAAIDLECDLSLQALDSIKMTEILYLLSMADWRVQPLMTTIKQWALHHKLTSSGELQKPTTLGLLCLLIYYLQTCQPAILPSLRRLQSLANGDNGFEIDGVRFFLPASPKSIPPSKNKDSLESLLHGFFDFFASFNFETQAISLIEGSTFYKNDKSCPLYMENPLSVGLNICRNVSQMNVEQLQRTMAQSAQTMSEFSGKSYTGSTRLRMLFERLMEDTVHLNIDSLFATKESDEVTEELDLSEEDIDKKEEQSNHVLSSSNGQKLDTDKHSVDCGEVVGNRTV